MRYGDGDKILFTERTCKKRRQT